MKQVLFVFCFFLVSLLSYSQKIELKGSYEGKKIYIQNPARKSDSVYCTLKVLVNGKNIWFENTSAFAISLDSMGFKIGDSLLIEIYHQPGCSPKVLQPEHVTIKSTFELLSISIDSNAILHWTTSNELKKIPYIIEQYRWNKWIKAGEVDGQGNTGVNSYIFQTMPHSGNNRFRLKQYTYIQQPVFTRAVEFLAPDQQIKILGNPSKLADELVFNKETMYELYDSNGNIVKKGFGKNIDLTLLKRGSYFLGYDDKILEVVKF